MSTVDYINRYFSEMTRILSEIPRNDIKQAIDLLFDTWSRRGTVFIMGNGGSASTASHFMCDLAKTTIVPGKKRFKVMGLVDNVPLVSAWTNDSGFGRIFSEQLEPWLERGDVLIGLSVHGGSGTGEAGPWSQNLVSAIKLARDRGVKSIGFSGFDGGALKKMVDVCIVVPIGVEPFGTPLVETFHVALHHLIVSALRQRIEASESVML